MLPIAETGCLVCHLVLGLTSPPLQTPSRKSWPLCPEVPVLVSGRSFPLPWARDCSGGHLQGCFSTTWAWLCLVGAFWEQWPMVFSGSMSWTYLLCPTGNSVVVGGVTGLFILETVWMGRRDGVGKTALHSCSMKTACSPSVGPAGRTAAAYGQWNQHKSIRISSYELDSRSHINESVLWLLRFVEFLNVLSLC